MLHYLFLNVNNICTPLYLSYSIKKLQLQEFDIMRMKFKV